MDLKVIRKSYTGHKFILYIIDEVTNYLITVPIHQAKSDEVGEPLIKTFYQNIVFQNIFSWIKIVPLCLHLMTYLLNKFNIKIRTVAPYNHQSLQAEHSIKYLSNILTKHLTNLDVAKIFTLGYFCLQTHLIP